MAIEPYLPATSRILVCSVHAGVHSVCEHQPHGRVRFIAYNHANQNLFKDDVLLNAFVARYDVRYILMDGSQYDHFTRLPSWKQGEWRLYFSDHHRAALFQRSDLHEGNLHP
jgi:hypothetical protein